MIFERFGAADPNSKRLRHGQRLTEPANPPRENLPGFIGNRPILPLNPAISGDYSRALAFNRLPAFGHSNCRARQDAFAHSHGAAPMVELYHFKICGTALLVDRDCAPSGFHEGSRLVWRLRASVGASRGDTPGSSTIGTSRTRAAGLIRFGLPIAAPKSRHAALGHSN